jgi:xylan 1,4-beta-xylosidase
MRKACFFPAMIVGLALGPSGWAAGEPVTEVIQIDASAASRPFPHFWEQMFGSGRANITLRQSWRHDLDATRTATGLRYVRFHDIFSDHNGVYSEGADGKPIYNWSYVDQIYDGILENNVRPFVELSFMPAALAASQKPHPFWYKPLPSPPRSYEKWASLERAKHRFLDG